MSFDNTKARWKAFRDELNRVVSWRDQFVRLGVEICGEPNAEGWARCRSLEQFGGEDRNPSASVNLNTGTYHDFRDGTTLNYYDLAVAVGAAPDWRTAQRQLAEQLGLKQPSRSRHNPYSRSGFEPRDWDADSAALYCNQKPGITLEGMVRAGCRLCRFMDQVCFYLRIYASNMRVIGHYYFRVDGQPFDLGTKQAKTIAFKEPGEDGGIIGDPAARLLASPDHETVSATTFYWTEGGTDLLALYSRFSDQNCFLTNPNGCSERYRDNQRVLFGRLKPKIILIADADEPGILGAGNRVTSIRDHYGGRERVKAVNVPYPIAPKHGKDLRDWCREFYDSPLEAIESFPEVQAVEPPARGQPAQRPGRPARPAAPPADPQSIQKAIRDLGIVVAPESTIGQCTLINLKTRCHLTAPVRIISASDIVTLCGAEIWRYARPARAPDGDPRATLAELRDGLCVFVHDALSAVAERPRIIAGDGIYPATEDDDVEPCLSTQARLYRLVDLSTVMEGATGYEMYEVNDITYRDIAIDVPSGTPWLDISKLNEALREVATPDDRMKVFNDLYQYLTTWRFSSPDQPLTLAAMVYATWLQRILDWRPIVCVTGESNSGKSWMMELVAWLYAGGGILINNPTAAAVLQRAGQTSLPVLIDEIDQMNRQQSRQLVGYFRSTGRGQVVPKGSVNGRQRHDYLMKHIFWLTGIYFGSDEVADSTRIIDFQLMGSEVKTIQRPTPRVAKEMGYRVLATSLILCPDILARYRDLVSRAKECGVMGRLSESYAVPYAVLGSITEADPDELSEQMVYAARQSRIRSLQVSEELSDHFRLLAGLMAMPIRLGRDAPKEEASVAELVRARPGEPLELYQDQLETVGMRVSETALGKRFLIQSKMLLQLARNLPDGTPSTGRVLNQVLKRMPAEFDVATRSFYIAGQTRSCIALKYEAVMDWLDQRSADLFPPDSGI